MERQISDFFALLRKEDIPITFEDHGTIIFGKFEVVAGAANSSLYHLAEFRRGGWYHCGQLFKTEHFGWRYGGNKFNGIVEYLVKWLQLWHEPSVQFLFQSGAD